jgi:hypothetical protein
MKQIWTSRIGQAAGKYGEHAPMAAVCCNACRTCVTTNVLSIALGAFTFAGLAVTRLARRAVARPSV